MFRNLTGWDGCSDRLRDADRQARFWAWNDYYRDLGVPEEEVDAEAERLVGLGATITVVMAQDGLDHYAVGMKDPEGSEFDIN